MPSNTEAADPSSCETPTGTEAAKVSLDIPAALAGERLDRALALLRDSSRSSACELIAAGGVRLNGVQERRRSVRLKEGDLLAVETSKEPSREKFPIAEAAVKFSVIHQEEEFLVIDKPAGLLVHPGAGFGGGTLCSGLLARYPEIAEVGERTRPGIVHRLDKSTTGLLVVARTQRSYASLRSQFEERSVKRKYEAVCWGELTTPAGLIDAPVGRSLRRPTLMAVSARGRPARTRYELWRRYAGFSRLHCRLETGRTHQIRVHLSTLGHPLVGDRAYGAPVKAFNRPPSAGELAALNFERPALHSSYLSFAHPCDARQVEFASELPSDISELLERLEPASGD